MELELDPQQPLGDPPRGTIQGLAEGADWTDAADPWATLAWAHGSGGGLFAEEVLLGGDGWVLEGIFERFEGGCYAVHTSYLSIEGDDFANVAQAQGECPEQQAADVPERRGWYVSVDATDPRFEDGLEWYRNALPRDPAVLDELGPAGF